MDVIEQLTALGFTEYEAKVYLALLHEHPGHRLSGRETGRRAAFDGL
jgi:Sugar-specific transcriptional regulator TrmB.